MWISENTSIAGLVETAYDIRPYQIQGADDWMQNDRFIVSAKIAPGAMKEQFREITCWLWLRRSGREIPEGDERGPDLIQAVKEQLGLTLHAEKVPVDTILIDHAEHVPAEN